MAQRIAATVNKPYPRRVQLNLPLNLPGPLSSPTMGLFDPRRDCRVYNAGRLMTVESFAWDGLNNRYLLFVTEDLIFTLPTQIIHHVPSPPFEVEGNPDLFDLTPGDNPDILAAVGGP
jgi:hypothetical protein